MPLFFHSSYAINKQWIIDADGKDLSTRTLRNAPNWDIHFSSQYVLRLENSGAIVFQADYNYRDQMYLDDENSPSLLSQDFSSWNAAITYQAAQKTGHLP